jgi:hypothetical protein
MPTTPRPPRRRPLLCELHAHTAWSDGELGLDEIVELYGARGFDVLSTPSRWVCAGSSGLTMGRGRRWRRPARRAPPSSPPIRIQKSDIQLPGARRGASIAIRRACAIWWIDTSW